MAGEDSRRTMIVTRIDADTLRVQCRAEDPESGTVGDLAIYVRRGDPRFEQCEKLIEPQQQ